MKVSIIIPVYNVESYIPICLDSLSRQSYKDIELIFIDDCGKDSSMEIVSSFIYSHPELDCKIVAHQQNRGLSAARNTGLLAATGDYVYFLDSDDSISDNCIKLLVTSMFDNLYDFVIGDYDVIGSCASFPPLLMKEGSYQRPKIFDEYASGSWYMMAWNKLCRRKFLLDSHLFFEEGLIHEDVVWSFKLALMADSMCVVKQPTYRYYVRSSSIMTSTSIEKDAEAYCRCYEEMTIFAKSHDGCSAGAYQIVEGRKSTFLFSLLKVNRVDLFSIYYSRLYPKALMSPLYAYLHAYITKAQLLRDVHYVFPIILGSRLKRLYYSIVYKILAQPFEGQLW